jgi:hypothetical protein
MINKLHRAITPALIMALLFLGAIQIPYISKPNIAFAQPQEMNVEITSYNDGDKVPSGELTISGSSSDDGSKETAGCEVYVDWNNMKPYQEVIPTGPNGKDDYSTWKFKYTSDYHLITIGNTNELTAKFYCHDSPEKAVWNTVNLVGVKDGNGSDGNDGDHNKKSKHDQDNENNDNGSNGREDNKKSKHDNGREDNKKSKHDQDNENNDNGSNGREDNKKSKHDNGREDNKKSKHH